MKYLVLVADGMADYPIAELGQRTPLEAAKTPNFDFIAQHGQLGRVKTIPDKMAPGSDVANITILGYDTKKYYSGRGPIEAVNLGIVLEENDVAFRCNLITAVEDKLVDYSAGHIHSKEASILINYVNKKLGSQKVRFYPGTSYRHIMVVKDGSSVGLDSLRCVPPHDITGKSISSNLPRGKNSQDIVSLMQNSREILSAHEINMVRVDLKENPANMIWFWGQGKKPAFSKFSEKYNLSGSIISAVDLLKGLGRLIGFEVINVEGATGYYDTNYEGKADAALKSLRTKDFVFLHVEAPDEAGHNGDLREKILAIERFDQLVLGKILQHFKDGEDFRILVLPDHATPISVKTHVSDAVCFAVYGKGIEANGFANYSEKEALKSELYFDKGYELMDYFIKGVK